MSGWPKDKQAQVYAVMDAVNARDFDALSRIPLDPAFEFRSLIAAAEGGIYVGLDGLRQWAKAVDDVWRDFRAEPVQYSDAGEDRAVVIFHVTGRAKGSGIPLDDRNGQVWTWRRGKLWRNDAYPDPDEALEAAGLLE
jgi:ketosteroid isomerase-like protein